MAKRNRNNLLFMGGILLFINLGLRRPLGLWLPDSFYFVFKSVILALVFYLGFHRRLGLRIPLRPQVGFWEQVRVSWVVLLYVFGGAIPTIIIGLINHPQAIWDSLLTALIAGCLEEYICRGLMLQAACQGGLRSHRQVLWAIGLSSIFFGMAHMSNLFIQPLSNTLFQVYYAMVLGIYFCAVVLRTGSLWWVMVPHFLMDFGAILYSDGSKVSAGPNSYAICLWLVVLLIGLYLLREKKLAHLFIAKS